MMLFGPELRLRLVWLCCSLHEKAKRLAYIISFLCGVSRGFLVQIILNDFHHVQKLFGFIWGQADRSLVEQCAGSGQKNVFKIFAFFCKVDIYFAGIILISFTEDEIVLLHGANS